MDIPVDESQTYTIDDEKEPTDISKDKTLDGEFPPILPLNCKTYSRYTVRNIYKINQ